MQQRHEEVHIQHVTFLGNQDGPFERLLKDKIVDTFGRRADVSRAYLVRVRVDNSESVMLALRADETMKATLVDEIGLAFASIFNARERLDIVFLTALQEEEVRRVCPPFFDR